MGAREGAELAELAELFQRDYGIDPARGGMIRALHRFVAERTAELGTDLRDYLARVTSDASEREGLVHAMTVNHSWFFRDPKQLEALGERMLELGARLARPLQLWVAGCAAGQEAWTMAMIAGQLGVPVRVLATDVDARAIVSARRGRYGAWNLRELPRPLWVHLEAVDEQTWAVREPLRGQVEFEVHNLCGPRPRRSFDLICCRNVLIYFDPARAHEVVAQMRACLLPHGELVLGAGDLMFQPQIASGSTRRVDSSRASQPPRRPRPRSAPAQGPRHEARGRLSVRASVPRLTDRARSAKAPVAGSGAPRPRANLEVLERAGLAISSGEVDVGLSLLEALVDRAPLLAEAHLWVGIAHHTLHSDQLAGEALRRARCLEPELWPSTLFAALNFERRGRWQAAARCWDQLERLMNTADAPPIEGTQALEAALPDWQSEARALAKQRQRSRTRGTLGGLADGNDD